MSYTKTRTSKRGRYSQSRDCWFPLQFICDLLCSLVSDGDGERAEGDTHGDAEFGSDTDLEEVMSR